MSAVRGCALFRACRVGRESRGGRCRDPGESNATVSSKSTCRGGRFPVCAGCGAGGCAQLALPNATSAGKGGVSSTASAGGQLGLVSPDALLPSAILRTRGRNLGRRRSPLGGGGEGNGWGGGGGGGTLDEQSVMPTAAIWSPRQGDLNGLIFESATSTSLSRHVYVHLSQSAVALASEAKAPQQAEGQEEVEGGGGLAGKSKITQRPSRPSPAETARTLTEICADGTLCTLTEDDWPLGTYVSFCLEADGNPIVRLDPAFVHAQHVRRDSRCSLLVQLDLPGQKKIQCTLKGRLHKVDDDDARMQMESAWQRRFPSGSADCDDDHDIYHLQVEDVLLTPNVTSDFYGAHKEDVWISAVDYREASADPLRDCAAQIVTDMNGQQWDDIRRFVSVFTGLNAEVKDAFFIWVDRLGFDMRVYCNGPQISVRDIRIPFAREVTDERDARSSLTMMAQMAWETERLYIPPDFPFLQTLREM